MFPLSSETHSHNIETPNPIEISQANSLFNTFQSTILSSNPNLTGPIPTGTLTHNLIPNPYNPNPTLSTNPTLTKPTGPNHQTPYILGFVFLSPPGVILEPLSSQEFLFTLPTRRVRFTTVIRVSKFQFLHSETKNQHITHQNHIIFTHHKAHIPNSTNIHTVPRRNNQQIFSRKTCIIH